MWTWKKKQKEDLEQEKQKKIKAIAKKKINFYYRLQNHPEHVAKRRKKYAILAVSGIVLLIMLVLESSLLIKKGHLQDSVDELQFYVRNKDHVEKSKQAAELNKLLKETEKKTADVQNIMDSIHTYPVITSEMLHILEDACPDKVRIKVKGYDSETGELSMDAVAPLVTDISDFINELKKLGLFRDVYYTGYKSIGVGMGYSVEVECLLKETAREEAAE